MTLDFAAMSAKIAEPPRILRCRRFMTCCEYAARTEIIRGGTKVIQPLMTPYYEHAGITIYHGDCREILPNICADVCIADPPYGMGKAGWDMKIVPVREWLPKCRYIGPTFVFTGVQGVYDYPRPDWIMAWVRIASTQRNGALKGFNNWEPILAYGLDTLKNDVVQAANMRDGDTGDHPTPKPVKLLRKLLVRTGGNTILDPFAGVGATLIAAKEMGKSAIGIEIEEKYCEIAAKRLSQEVLQF